MRTGKLPANCDPRYMDAWDHKGALQHIWNLPPAHDRSWIKPAGILNATRQETFRLTEDQQSSRQLRESRNWMTAARAGINHPQWDECLRACRDTPRHVRGFKFDVNKAGKDACSFYVLTAHYVTLTSHCESKVKKALDGHPCFAVTKDAAQIASARHAQACRKPSSNTRQWECIDIDISAMSARMPTRLQALD